jgi:hypothetical protein
MTFRGWDGPFSVTLIQWPSLVVKGVDGVEEGGLVSGIEAEEKTYEAGKPEGQKNR